MSRYEFALSAFVSLAQLWLFGVFLAAVSVLT